MSIASVTSAAPSQDLTTVATVVEEMEMTCSPAELRTLERKITSVSAQIASYCHRVFGEERVTMNLKGYGSSLLILDRAPIVEVLSVTHDGSPITDHSIDDRGVGSLYRGGGWTWTVGGFGGQFSGGGPRAAHPHPNSEEALFVVDAWVGWILPSFPSDYTPNASSVDMPTNIEQAALIAVKDAYDSRAGGGSRGSRGEISSVKTTGVAISYAARNASALATQARLLTGLPTDAVALLQDYVQIK